MNYPNNRIPEEKTQEVFTLAATLYAKHNQSYSVKELMEAGAEAKIPPEFIQQAVELIQLQQQKQALAKEPSKLPLVAMVIGIPVLTALTVVGLIARNAMLNAQEKQVPFVPIQQAALEPPSSVANTVGNFKCGTLDFTGKDLRQKNFQGADCTNAKLGNVNLSGVNLEGANLSNADLKSANLNGANLKGANLTNAKLSDADLTNADLERANVSKSDLTNAKLEGANLNGADLADVKNAPPSAAKP